MSDKDTLYREQAAEAGFFRFDGRVAAVRPERVGQLARLQAAGSRRVAPWLL